MAGLGVGLAAGAGVEEDWIGLVETGSSKDGLSLVGLADGGETLDELVAALLCPSTIVMGTRRRRGCTTSGFVGVNSAGFYVV